MGELHYPERVELADRRGRMMVTGAGALCSAIAGSLMVRSGSSLGWLVLGVCALLGALMVTTWISPPRLIVAPEGFGLTTLMGRSLTAWTEVSAFRSGVPPFGGSRGRTLIMYDRRGRRAPCVLAAEFGINTQTLAEQLETYRLDAVFAAEQPAPPV